jgi:outer membrane protein OmpA-like peptidoglycan-associated protein/tetratricopeptide (TPR) repeat protein
MRLTQMLCASLAFFPFCVSVSLAQTDSLKKADQYYKDGMDAFNYEHRNRAIVLFKRAILANPNYAAAHLMAGKSIMSTMKKNQALTYFKKAYALDSKVDEDILFYIGQAYHYAEEFDSALMYYDQYNFKLSHMLAFERSMKVNEVNRKIFECRNAKVFKANAVQVTIENLSKAVNSEYPDYAPNISADESLLVFTTRRPDTNGNNNLAEDQEFYEEIHVSKKVNGEWQPSINVGGPLNTAFHNSNISLSPNGKEMFVYKDENGGDLYETDLQADGTWAKPKRLNGYINSPYLENSAAVTLDDEKLFFVSDRPGGYGGTDIYVALKNKRGEWGEAHNLGSVINTEFDEEDVFVSANGQHIYFSSDGHAGMGDLDIYRSTFDSATMQWSEPLNLGYPINSVENDIYFVLSGDERYAYISSIRDNTVGDQDIYRIDMKNWKPITRKELMEKELTEANLLPLSKQNTIITTTETNPSKKETNFNPITLSVNVMDELGKPLDATVKLIDEKKNETVLSKSTDGNYQAKIPNEGYAKFTLAADALGYVSSKSSIHVLGNVENNSIKESMTLEKSNTSSSLALNMYYDVDKDTPNNLEDINILQTLLKENTSWKVLIEGHTDSYGDENYNQQLSERRVNQLKKILVDAGIASSRILTTGYGEKKPITDNGSSAGRKLNRRTTVTILK